MASLRQSNSVGSLAAAAPRHLERLRTPAVPGYDPLKDIRGTQYEVMASRFLTSGSPQETRLIMRGVDQRAADVKTQDEAGLSGVLSGVAAGAVDPVTWLVPEVGMAKAIGSPIIGKAVTGMLSSAAQEAALHATQPERPWDDFGQTVIGGGVGEVAMHGVGKVLGVGGATHPSPRSGPSVAAPDPVAPAPHPALAVALAAPLSPRARVSAWSGSLRGELEAMRDGYARFRMDLPDDGRPPAHLVDATAPPEGPQPLTWDEFRRPPDSAMAGRPGQAEAARARNAIEERVIAPLTEGARQAGLVPADLSPQASTALLGRVYDLDAISADRAGFARRLRDAFALDPQGPPASSAQLDMEARQAAAALLSVAPGHSGHDAIAGLAPGLRDRMLRLPDAMVRDYLEQDVEQVARSLSRSLAQSIERRRLLTGADEAEVLSVLERAGMRTDPPAPLDPWGLARHGVIAPVTLERFRRIMKQPDLVVPQAADPVFRTEGLARAFAPGLDEVIQRLARSRPSPDAALTASDALDLALDGHLTRMSDPFTDFDTGVPLGRAVGEATDAASLAPGMTQWRRAAEQYVALISQAGVLKALRDLASGAEGPGVARLRALARDLGLDASQLGQVAEQVLRHGQAAGSLLWARTGQWLADLPEDLIKGLLGEAAKRSLTPPEDEPDGGGDEATQTAWIEPALINSLGLVGDHVLGVMAAVTNASRSRQDAAIAQSVVVAAGLGLLADHLALGEGADASFSGGIDRSGLAGWAAETPNLDADEGAIPFSWTPDPQGRTRLLTREDAALAEQQAPMRNLQRLRALFQGVENQEDEDGDVYDLGLSWLDDGREFRMEGLAPLALEPEVSSEAGERQTQRISGQYQNTTKMGDIVIEAPESARLDWDFPKALVDGVQQMRVRDVLSGDWSAPMALSEGAVHEPWPGWIVTVPAQTRAEGWDEVRQGGFLAWWERLRDGGADLPPIVPRAAWARQEPDTAALDTDRTKGSYSLITLHHTGSRNTPEAVEELHRGRESALSYRLRQLKGLGRAQKYDNADVGYNFMIAPDGAIYEGRGLQYENAQVRGRNVGNIGIAFLGDYTGKNLTPAQIEAVTKLMGVLQEIYSIDPDQVFTHAQFDETRADELKGPAVSGQVSKIREGARRARR